MIINGRDLKISQLQDWAFRRPSRGPLQIADGVWPKIEKSRNALLGMIEKDISIYGVTTGFGDSGNRTVQREHMEMLQDNLVSYLLCGSGPILSADVARAILLIRLNSLSRGLSGVTPELIQRLEIHCANDWLPQIPVEGSLGASGDLIPLAYLAENLRGEGSVLSDGQTLPMTKLLKDHGLTPYKFQAKEALAIVNGTSAMAGYFAVNLNHAQFLLDLMTLNTSWLCITLKGRTEAFGPLVNEIAKESFGQKKIAATVRDLLAQEKYESKPLDQIKRDGTKTSDWIQDRYSLRCVPQILGPVVETLTLCEKWLTEEINSSSDNPLVSDINDYASGGNFYGGYLSQGMDYLKISLAHMADLIDRQTAYIIDDKSNRGLPANLSGYVGSEDGNLHHGLKGLHQATSAITSEILARATPNGIFSRSSESHNQDKVSLGMSAAAQCASMIEPVFTILTLQTVILAQALDLVGHQPQGEKAKKVYELVRRHIPFVKHDINMGDRLQTLRSQMIELSRQNGL